MNIINDAAVRDQLLDRRQRLQTAITESADSGYLERLLRDVDIALEKFANGSYGICETCHEPIEQERLIVDPLIRNCIDHLTQSEQRALERDLDLAFQIQNALLPKNNFDLKGWSMAYHYEPAGSVSGDYCDVITSKTNPNSFYFLVGDVSGKGVAASILMGHLHAMFRSLLITDFPVNELIARANRIFCEGTTSSHFATLVCARANTEGIVEVSNAGHCYPLLVSKTDIKKIEPTGLPLGLFCNSEFSVESLMLQPGESIVLYTDGLTEAKNSTDMEYGENRLSELVSRYRSIAPKDLLRTILQDVLKFKAGIPKNDDLTVMILRRDAS